MKEWIEFFIEEMLPIIIIAIIVISVSAITVQTVKYYQCSSFKSVTGKTTKYKLIDSCYVDFNNEWLRYDEYKEVRKDLYIKQELNQ